MFSDGIENLLIDQVRVSFSNDTLKLQSISQNKDQVRAKARAKESKLNDGASSRLEKLQACLDRFVADFNDVSAEIKERDEDLRNLRALIDRGGAGHWPDSAMAAAKSGADAQLSGSAQEIAQCERQIEALLTSRDRLFQEGQLWAVNKNELEELLSLLSSGSEPKPFQDALTKERSGFNFAFQTSSDDFNRALAEELKLCSVSENELSSLDTAKALARDNPGDAQARRDLLVSQGKIGDLYLQRGAPDDADRALAAHHAALETSEALLRANPGNAQALWDLVVSLFKLGKLAATKDEKNSASGYFGKALQILGTMDAEGRELDPQMRGGLAQLRKMFEQGGKDADG